MLSNIEEIKQKLDIADLIQEYVKLSPAGANFKARCPFHNEKTPSFMVSSEKQIWHCFGCGAGGDHFEFIKRIENIEFPEALRILAAKANVTLDYKNPEAVSRKTKLLDLNEEIAAYWHKKLLSDPAAEPIRKYLAERKVAGQTMEEFNMGYAQDAWNDAILYLQNKGYSLLEINQAGVSVVGEKGRPYDRFRGRLIFPIKNVHGGIVGFGARKMKEDDPGGKYINSPQTEIYNKSEILYNLHQAKSEIKRLDYAILVEGYMDALACHQAGTKNAVAVSGTSLTEGQIKILKRYTDNLMIAFDADVAGTLANLRGIDLAWQAGFNVKVIHLLGGKDPDEIIRNDKEKWRQLVTGADNFMDYIFTVTLQGLNLSRIDHKKKAAQKLLKVISKLGDEVEKGHYLKKLAGELDVAEEALRGALSRLKADGQPLAPRAEKSTPMIKIDQERLLAEQLLSMFFKYFDQTMVVSQQFEPEIISDDWLRDVYKKFIIYYNKNHSFDFKAFCLEFTNDDESGLNKIMLLAETLDLDDKPLTVKQEFIQLINRLKRYDLDKKLKSLNSQIAKAEKEHNEEFIKQLSGEFSKILSQLASL